jgi:Holliday junction resolvase
MGNSERTETEIQKEILEYLRVQGFFVWRQNSGAIKRKYAVGQTGIPDIIGIGPGGVFLGIEVKKPGKQLSTMQTQFFVEAQNRGAVVIRAESVADVKALLITRNWIPS